MDETHVYDQRMTWAIGEAELEVVLLQRGKDSRVPACRRRPAFFALDFVAGPGRPRWATGQSGFYVQGRCLSCLTSRTSTSTTSCLEVWLSALEAPGQTVWVENC